MIQTLIPYIPTSPEMHIDSLVYGMILAHFLNNDPHVSHSFDCFEFRADKVIDIIEDDPDVAERALRPNSFNHRSEIFPPATSSRHLRCDIFPFHSSTNEINTLLQLHLSHLPFLIQPTTNRIRDLPPPSSINPLSIRTTAFFGSSHPTGIKG